MGLALLLVLPTFSQEILPYYCDFDQDTHESEWEFYRLGANTDEEFYTWEFENDELVHYYPVGGTVVTDDWIVSPEFDFSNGGSIDSVSHAFGGFGFPTEEDTVMIYVITGSSNPNLAWNLTPLKLLTDETYNPDNIWRKSYNLSIPSMSGESHIAFRYKTINNWLDVRIDDLHISGGPLSDDDMIVDQRIEVFPNPSSDYITIDGITANSTVRILNVAGQTVFESNPTISQMRLDIQNFTKGLYILNVQTANQISTSQKLVIE